MNLAVRRQVRLWRQIGAAMPCQYQWGCRVRSTHSAMDVYMGASDGLGDVELGEPGGRLHDGLLKQVPPLLRASTRSEVGVVRTETEIDGRMVGSGRGIYALATCSDVLVTLDGHLSPAPVTPWRGTFPASELDRDLPVVLGPSAVLSLTSGMIEMAEDGERVKLPRKAVPGWLSVHPTARSPYPPHDAPPGIEDVPDDQLPDEQRAALMYWAARTEHWMRPMRTTRASRGQYEVHASLPVLSVGPALWVEALTSLDTRGRYWQASLSVGRADGRRWLTQPWQIEIGAGELLEAAGQVDSLRPALDRDPVDGESFGWAPTLLARFTAGTLGLRRSAR